MRVRYAFLAALLFAGFRCGAQPPAAVAEPGSRVSRNGCTVDPKQICLRKLDLREIALYDNGVIKRDTHSLDQSERHLTILTDYRYPNGEPLALVNLSVRYADAWSHAGRSHTNGRTPPKTGRKDTSVSRGCAYRMPRDEPLYVLPVSLSY